MSFIYKNNTASKLQISTEELFRRDGNGLRSWAGGEGVRSWQAVSPSLGRHQDGVCHS